MPEERWPGNTACGCCWRRTSDALQDGSTQDGNIARARLMRADLLIGIRIRSGQGVPLRERAY